MKIYNIYEAEDGHTFDSAAECIRHEYFINHLPHCVHWYTETKEELYPTTTEEIEKAWGRLRYYKIDNISNWREQFDEFMSYFGYGDRDMTPGLYEYKWDTDVYDWYRKNPHGECPFQVGWVRCKNEKLF